MCHGDELVIVKVNHANEAVIESCDVVILAGLDLQEVGPQTLSQFL